MKAFICALVLGLWCTTCAAASPEPGLLFYLSGDQQFNADFAAGNGTPNYNRYVKIIPDGAKGPGFQCADNQVLSYWAPGNIYSQRGTLSFFWRSRYAVGATAFPLFRVAYADSSSWDMAWLRVDYNGHGFDAFVTDDSLARTRVSVTVDPFPKPNEWVHLAISWDETRGIRFYVNGKLAAINETGGAFNTGLDQFGPHSRVISPHQVQSDYNFVRGGDIDEVRIYDRMLADSDVATLAKGDGLAALTALPARTMDDKRSRDEWNLRYGFNHPDNPPPYYAGQKVSVRKVEISDAYDMKRWWWKATDGIRETTWPGVYNRSRLPGRNDYFQLPDWDCYVDSGKAITFIMPEEPWNQIEISGAAWGKMELLKPDGANDGPAESILFRRGKGNDKTINTLPVAIKGRKIRFTNDEQEEPIGELVAYNVTPGREPAGTAKLAYRLTAAAPTDATLTPLVAFLKGRHPADERAMLVAQPVTDGAAPAVAAPSATAAASMPLVHILIPDTWDKMSDGLDGIAIDLPAMNVKATHGDLFPLNIQVTDPLWLYRNMFDFTFSVKPGEAKTLWLDLRDRLLPAGRGFFISIAGAGGDFSAATLEGAQIRLIFKSHEAARKEHELDRFTQVKDVYAMSTEEHPKSEQLNMWNRLQGDLQDLMRVNPNHSLGKYYAAVALGAPRPAFKLPDPPAGVPLWAFRQADLLGRVKKFADWYVDNRQSEFGDFGGGISDDTDLLNEWPGIALMGCTPEKLRDSAHRLLEASFNNGMFTNGLCTIQADELHSYEEGINCLGENLIIDYGNPRQIERAMATARGLEFITGINPAGNRLFKSSYYNGAKYATDAPWDVTKPYSYLIVQPPELLVDYNGNPEVKKVLLELADGQLAHRHQDANGQYSLAAAIEFTTGKESAGGRGYFPWPLFWTAWQWTGDHKYLDPITDGGASTLGAVNANLLDILNLRDTWGGRGRGRGAPNTAARLGREGSDFTWQLTGDKHALEEIYGSQIDQCELNDYIGTEGSVWIDRVGVPITDLQRTRLGGVALVRNANFPGNTVGWKFAAPANDQSVAILVANATPTSFKVIAYNLDAAPVTAAMIGCGVDPGMWEVSQGVDTNNDDVADQAVETRSAGFERSSELPITFPPHVTSVLTFKLKTPGTPYWTRPDLGISKEDIVVQGNVMGVTVHSIGGVDAPASTVNLLDKSGKVIASAAVPALAAPLDLLPKTAVVNLTIPAGADLEGGAW